MNPEIPKLKLATVNGGYMIEPYEVWFDHDGVLNITLDIGVHAAAHTVAEAARLREMDRDRFEASVPY